MHALQRRHGARTSALAGLSIVIYADSAREWDALVETVATVEARHPAPQEVLVVIDHDDALLALATQALPEARVIANEEARGLQGARNTGVRHANGDVVAFLDAF